MFDLRSHHQLNIKKIRKRAREKSQNNNYL